MNLKIKIIDILFVYLFVTYIFLYVNFKCGGVVNGIGEPGWLVVTSEKLQELVFLY